MPADQSELRDGGCELGGFLLETTDLTCRGFVWQDGVTRELPPLGGHHSFATGVNARGDVVGWAETAVHDPTCVDNQVLQFRAVVWDPKDGSRGKIKARELRPFAHDSASAATAINDAGPAVGISGDCDQAVGRFSAKHAVLWEPNGKMREIPNLGGTTWHTPMDINGQGDVVGSPTLPAPATPRASSSRARSAGCTARPRPTTSGRFPEISSARLSRSTGRAK